MGSVTKTTIEGVGDVMKSTSYHFSSFEDFMEYECVVDEKGQQDNQPAVKELVVGKQYRVVEDISEHRHNIGEIVTVMEYDEEDYRLPYRVEDSLRNSSWLGAEEVEEI